LNLFDITSDYLDKVGTGAADLLLSFFGDYVPSTAARAGTKRRVTREDAKRAAVAAFHADTPALPPTRQVRRAECRAEAKQATLYSPKKKGKGKRPTNWSWREVFRMLAAADAEKARG
jgi:hypothetical protein